MATSVATVKNTPCLVDPLHVCQRNGELVTVKNQKKTSGSSSSLCICSVTVHLETRNKNGVNFTPLKRPYYGIKIYSSKHLIYLYKLCTEFSYTINTCKEHRVRNTASSFSIHTSRTKHRSPSAYISSRSCMVTRIHVLMTRNGVTHLSLDTKYLLFVAYVNTLAFSGWNWVIFQHMHIITSHGRNSLMVFETCRRQNGHLETAVEHLRQSTWPQGTIVVSTSALRQIRHNHAAFAVSASLAAASAFSCDHYIIVVRKTIDKNLILECRKFWIRKIT